MVYKYENTVYIPKEWWSETNTPEQAIEIRKTIIAIKVIIDLINTLDTLDELREGMKEVSNEDMDSIFEYGFGGGHFWLKQKVDGVTLDGRIFLVTEK